MSLTQPLRFGIFLPPMHKTGVNPTLAIERDLQLIEHLDRLGYDEVWVGEHHSGGSELFSSPEMLLAAAAQRTRYVKLGTGVISLPYHHPFHVADRLLFLDQISNGRMMFGAGPGQLPTDAAMLGIGDASLLRPRMEEALDVILRLLAGEVVTAESEWFTVREGRLQMSLVGPLDAAVTATISPSGPKLAGRHGIGMLSLAATDPTGADRLASHWEVVEEQSAESGHTPDRSSWRLVGPMHIAETVEQAKQECEYGLRWMYDYLAHVSPTALPKTGSTSELADLINESGRGVIGTPEMAVAQIERLAEKSGGFGAYLFQGADFARHDAILRSYSLFAEEVMPRFNGQLPAMEASYDLVMEAGERSVAATRKAQEDAAAAYKSKK